MKIYIDVDEMYPYYLWDEHASRPDDESERTKGTKRMSRPNETNFQEWCGCHDSWDQCPCAEGGHPADGSCGCCPLGTGICGPMPSDRLYLDLKGARERLCRAQVAMPSHWRSDLDSAVAIIDNVGSSLCPDQWSRYDQPGMG